MFKMPYIDLCFKETGESTWTCPPELKSKETTEGDVKETRSIQGSDLVTTNT